MPARGNRFGLWSESISRGGAMKKSVVLILFSVLGFLSSAEAAEWLMKVGRRVSPHQLQAELRAAGRPVLAVEDLRFNGWYLVRTPTESWSPMEARNLSVPVRASWVEPNKPLRWFNQNSQQRPGASLSDPIYLPQPPRSAGADPMLNQQWSLRDTGFLNVQSMQGHPNVVVAVIDTGVDYNHPELSSSMWLNPGEAGEKANNGRDDDGNGYVDDFIGWDFVENDNKPFDKTSFFGNPGHGTHCAGVIASARNNSTGIAGIAAGVRIMAIRFLSENGQGTTANAVRAVKYATDMGAWITSNSWGGPEEDGDDSRILREVFADAAAKGRIAVVAAGNESLDVDKNPRQVTPASYNLPNQITVAATGQSGSLASFSNFGKTLVHLGAPGVGILSTVPNERFRNMDGTSMATPIVAAATALFWSQNMSFDGATVRRAVLTSVTPTSALQGRTVTGGRLNIENLMRVSSERVPRRF